MEPLHIERGNALLREANVIVQVRTGVMTVIALEAMLAATHRFRVDVPGKRGALLVIGPRAEMVAPILRKRQVQGLQGLMRDPLASVCIVIEGSSPTAALYRSLARADQLMASNGMVCETVELGARWLADAVGDVDVAMIEDLATQARAAANRT